MATEKVKVLKIDTNPAQTSVKELRTQLKELKDTLLSCEQGTEQYNNALKQAAEIQHTLKEQMEQVNAVAMDTGQILSNCTKAIGGMVAGFQAAKAVMNLFGVENEDVLKSLQKMQSLMALTQSFSGIEAGIKAFKRLGMQIKVATANTIGLSKALTLLKAATPVFAAISAAVAVLAANWDKVTKAFEEWGVVSNRVNQEEIERLNTLKNKVIELDDAYKNIQRNQAYKKMNSEAKANYDALADSLALLTAEYNKLNAEREQALANNDGARLREIQEQTIKIRLEMKSIESSMKNIIDDSKSYAKTQKEIIEEQKKAREDLLKRINEELNKELAIIELEGGDKMTVLKRTLEVEQRRLRYIERNTEAYVRQQKRIKELQLDIKEIEFDETAAEATIKNLNPDIKTPITATVPLKPEFVIEEEESVDDIDDKINELVKKYGTDATGLLIDEWDAARIEIRTTFKSIFGEEYEQNELYQRLMYETDVKYENMRRELFNETIRSRIESYATLGESVADIFDGLGDLMEEGSEEAKALQTMAAVINMISGIVAAMSGVFTTHSGIWDVAIAAAQATAIAIAGAANIAKIQQTNKNNAASMAGSVKSSVSSSAVSTINAPLQYTQAMQGASIERAVGESRSNKVYVTETDITNTQNRVRVTENEARF